MPSLSVKETRQARAVAQMGPRSAVVIEIRSQGSLEMTGVQDREMILAVSSYGANQPFGVRILQGTLLGNAR